MADTTDKKIKETSDIKSKFSGIPMTEEEYEKWQQTWIDIEESIEGLEEQNQ